MLNLDKLMSVKPTYNAVDKAYKIECDEASYNREREPTYNIYDIHNANIEIILLFAKL